MYQAQFQPSSKPGVDSTAIANHFQLSSVCILEMKYFFSVISILQPNLNKAHRAFKKEED